MLDKVKKLLFSEDGEYWELALQLLKGINFKLEDDVEIADYLQKKPFLNWLAIEYEIVSVENITKLNLWGLVNNNPKIFDSIPRFENLLWLSLTYNNLKEFPEQVLELKKLQYLDLSQNEIKFLPKQIAEFENLQVLDIALNPFDNLEEEIKSKLSQMKNLKKLIIYPSFSNGNFEEVREIIKEWESTLLQLLPNVEIVIDDGLPF